MQQHILSGLVLTTGYCGFLFSMFKLNQTNNELKQIDRTNFEKLNFEIF